MPGRMIKSGRLRGNSRRIDDEILRCILRYQGADEIPENIFEELAFKIFLFQYLENKNYRKYCEIEGKNPQNLKSWKDIPAMPAEGFKELTLRTFPAKKVARVFKTSGTTRGRRGSHYFDTLKLYEAAVLPSFRKYLLPDRSRMEMFFLTASPQELSASSLSYMMGVVQKKFSFGTKARFYVHQGNLLSAKLAYDLLSQKKPVMILSTAFSLKSFLDYLEKNKISIRLKPGSRLMETGGFKGRANEVSKKVLYRESEKRLGISPFFCVSEYGMTELSSQFYDTTLYDRWKGLKRKPFKAPPAWMRTVVIDPQTGEEAPPGQKGLLRHFDLANRGSVLAVQTQDIGIRRGEGFEFIGRAKGAALRGCSLTYEDFLNLRR